MTSCTEPVQIRPKPVDSNGHHAPWSPNRQGVGGTVRPRRANTVEVSSPATLNMVGIMSSKPLRGLKVVRRARLEAPG